MIGREICKLKDLLDKNSELNKFIVQGLFEEFRVLAGSGNIQDYFIKGINPQANKLMIETLQDGRLSIRPIVFHEKKEGQDPSIMTTTQTFVIDYFKPGMPVYNSEY